MIKKNMCEKQKNSFKETATPQQDQSGRRAGFVFDDIDYQIMQFKKEKFFSRELGENTGRRFCIPSIL